MIGIISVKDHHSTIWFKPAVTTYRSELKLKKDNKTLLSALLETHSLEIIEQVIETLTENGHRHLLFRIDLKFKIVKDYIHLLSEDKSLYKVFKLEKLVNTFNENDLVKPIIQ